MEDEAEADDAIPEDIGRNDNWISACLRRGVANTRPRDQNHDCRLPPQW